MRKIKFLAVVVATFLVGGCVQATIGTQVSPARHLFSFYRILKVNNGLAHRVLFSELDAKEGGRQVVLGPGSSADIPFRVYEDRTRVAVRGHVLDNQDQIIGTVVFSDTFSERRRELVWHITRYQKLCR